MEASAYWRLFCETGQPLAYLLCRAAERRP